MKNHKTKRSVKYDLPDGDVTDFTTVDPRVPYGVKTNDKLDSDEHLAAKDHPKET